jgi:hypothetical protein
MGNLSVDPLAIAALVGFLSLIGIMFGLAAWLWIKAGKAAGEK